MGMAPGLSSDLSSGHSGTDLAHADRDVIDGLDASVRERVRRAGVDPHQDHGAVRRIIDTVVAEHDQRALTGAVTTLSDANEVTSELVARIAGFGPLQALFQDESVEEIWINAPDRVFVARAGRHELTNVMLRREQVDELVERMLATTGRRVDLSQPFVDAMLPGGHRLHVVLEGISRDFAAVNTSKPKPTARFLSRDHAPTRRPRTASRCRLRAHLARS